MPIQSSGSPATYLMPMRPNLAGLRLCIGTGVPFGCPLRVTQDEKGRKGTDLFIALFDK
jgi:hypothetical protein